MKKTVTALILTLLLTGMLTMALNVQPAKSDYAWSETIYIRADGSIEPLGAPVSTVDMVTYTLADNIVDAASSYDAKAIIIQRDNIIVDGAGYTLQGTRAYYSRGIELTFRSNVTIKNMKITAFEVGIALISSRDSIVSGNNITNNFFYGIVINSLPPLFSSSDNSVSGNTVANNGYSGIGFARSSNCIVSGNNITANTAHGIELYRFSNGIVSGNCITATLNYGIKLTSSSNNNSVSGNTVTANNYAGIALDYSSNNNSVSGNTVANNGYGILLGRFEGSSPDYNLICHNDFIGNSNNVNIVNGSGNAWDDGYPSGGNYWSDYAGVDLYGGPNQNEIGSDGIGDTPYIINSGNSDGYPLMKPFPWPQHDIGITYVSRAYFDWLPIIILPLKTVVGQRFPLDFNVFVMNYGNSTETFNVTAYANTTAIQTLTITLPGRSSTILNSTWDTTGFSYGNYTISVVADNVSGEADVSDNTRIAGAVHVGIPGDVNGDGYVGIDDIFEIAVHFGQEPWQRDWNPRYDINGDNYVGVDDIFTAAIHFGEQENP